METFQTCSDLNLRSLRDISKLKEKIIPKADILLVCGNVSKISNISYIRFLEYVSTNFKKVLIIPGRLEYINNNFNTIELLNRRQISKTKRFKNVIVLNDSIYETESYIIFGSVFWSSIGIHKQFDILNNINDFKKISCSDEFISISDINRMNVNSINFINKNLRKYKNDTRVKILITNFIPIDYQTLLIYNNINRIISELSCNNYITALSDPIVFDYYFSDNLELCKKFEICCFGNINSKFKFKINKTIFACNSFVV